MPIQASAIVRRCVETLQDTTSVRWPIAELVRYLNDAQREVVLYRPDSMVTTATKTLSAGSRQSIPSGGLKLMDVVRNTSGNRKSIRLVAREILDSQTPGWHNIAGTTEILHYVYDPRDPSTFYVYPPASVGASVELVYTSSPVDIAEPPDGSTFTAVSGSLSVPDIYGNVVQDYVLYRAYMKDSEYAGNAARAQAHYAAFANALGIEVKATVAVAPTSAGNPNTVRQAPAR